MKNLVFFFLMLGCTLFANNELQWVDEQIDAIKPKRTGLEDQRIVSIKDPFIFLEKNKTQKKEKKQTENIAAVPVSNAAVFTSSTHTATEKKGATSSITLKAIMNQSALINGQWYKTGEKFGSYKVEQITSSSVVLKRGSKRLTLSTKSEIHNLKIIK